MSGEEELPMFRNVLNDAQKEGRSDVMLWFQCFASYVAILSSKFPSATPELLSYMAMIIKCARDYEGIAWAQYDRNFRKASGRPCAGHTYVDQTIYTVCFNLIAGAWCVPTACLILTCQLSTQKYKISHLDRAEKHSIGPSPGAWSV